MDFRNVGSLEGVHDTVHMLIVGEYVVPSLYILTLGMI